MEKCKYCESNDLILDFIKKSIDISDWEIDSLGHQFLNKPVLFITTRYENCKSSPCFMIGNDEYALPILYTNHFIEGSSEEDCKLKTKQWFKDNLEKAISIIIENKDI